MVILKSLLKTILQLYFTLKKVCLSAVKVVGTYNINK